MTLLQKVAPGLKVPFGGCCLMRASSGLVFGSSWQVNQSRREVAKVSELTESEQAAGACVACG